MVKEAPPIDPTVWMASCPSSMKIPAVGSRVYYFPQGHAEQCTSDPDFGDVRVSRCCYLSYVAGIRYLADAETDEAFIRISLEPTSAHNAGPSNPNPNPNPSAVEELKSAKAHAKMLTQSDSNNGGGFSVLKACAMSIFPPLDYTDADTPVQMLEMTDLLGNQWKFRHIYRGSPRRHLLTSGWSKFVDAKNIVSGDSIVFIRKDDNLFVGVRRRPQRIRVPDDVESAKNTVGFVRNRRGRVAPETVVEAVKAAEEGRPFDVDFYPGKGTPEVVVEAAAVSKAAAAGPVAYAVGATVRAKLTIDGAKPSGMWRIGTVTAVSGYDRSPWPGSPWRMLQVTWKDIELNPDRRGVSPWEVEPVPIIVGIGSPHAAARIPMPPPQSDSLAAFWIDSPHATAKIPVPLTWSDLLATVTTKMFESSDGPVPMDGTTGVWPAPPCDRNETLPAGTQGLEQGPNVATVSNRERTPSRASSDDVPQRQVTMDSVNEAQNPNVATVSNREGPPPQASRNDVPQRQGATDSGSIAQGQVRLFGVTFAPSISHSDGDANRGVEDAVQADDGNTTTT